MHVTDPPKGPLVCFHWAFAIVMLNNEISKKASFFIILILMVYKL